MRKTLAVIALAVLSTMSTAQEPADPAIGDGLMHVPGLVVEDSTGKVVGPVIGFPGDRLPIEFVSVVMRDIDGGNPIVLFLGVSA